MDKLVFNYNDKTLESCGSTIVCGIINVTPDSFSDGGKYYKVEDAVKRAKELVRDGAKMLDIGGESTRPGSSYVQIQDEINRVVPAIKEIKKVLDVPISVDTWKSEVAEKAIEAGADIINDITGFLGDKNMAEVVSKSKAGAIIMFNPVIARPNHESSKIFPTFGGEGVFSEEEIKEFMQLPIEDVMDRYFAKSLDLCKKYNIAKERIMLDPGIGFGLTKKENLTLINKIDILKNMGYFTFLGVSRKRFISNILKDNGFDVESGSEESIKNRDLASSYLTALAALKGVEVVRVHTAKEHLMASLIADSVRMASEMEDINFGAYVK